MPSFASPFAGYLWSMLCHSLWTVPTIGLIISFRAEDLPPCRRERRLRYAIFACLVAPGLFALAQAGFETESTSSANRFENSSESGFAPKNSTDNPAEKADSAALELAASATPSFRISLRNVVRQTAPWAIFAWSAGIFVLIARLFLGSIVFRIRTSSGLPDRELQSIANSLARRMRMNRRPEVRISNAVSQPMVVGLLHPAVIVPESWPMAVDANQIEAVLAHEIAHIRRADLRNRIFERAAAIIWFFHPAMHRMLRKAAMWREIAADRLAVDATGNPLALARALESFALQASVRDSKPAFGLPLLASRLPSHLFTRVGSILGTEESRISKPERRLRWAIGLSLLILGAFATFLVQSRPFAAGSKIRPALPIGGTANVSVGEFDPAAPKVVYEVRLVNVDTQFAGETLRTASKLPPGQVLPDQFVIGRELARTLTSHPSANCMLFPLVTASEDAPLLCRWEAPNQAKIATIELHGRPVPDKVRKEKVWTELRFVGRPGTDGLELQSDVTDFHDRLKIEKKTIPGNPSPVIYAASVTEERKSNGTRTLKPGESLCIRLGESMEPYRKEPRFLYETVLGEKGTRVSQFVRLAIVTARAAGEEAE